MNNNAKLIYESLNSYSNVEDLIGQAEHLFLDFKKSSSRGGKMSNDDKKNYSKAASGFAHSDGGAIVWGIKATKNADGVDEASSLCPIKNVGRFCQELNGYAKNATEPAVEGIEHKIIQNENSSSDGFVVSFFPKSINEHRVFGKGKSNGFYKRFGDSFVSLGTSDIKSLFLRSLTPDVILEIISDRDTNALVKYTITLENIGNGVAKNCSINIDTNLGVHDWYDCGGNSQNKTADIISMSGSNNKLIVAQNNIVIHPNQKINMAILMLTPETTSKVKNSGFMELGIYSENMKMKTKRIEFKNGIIKNDR